MHSTPKTWMRNCLYLPSALFLFLVYFKYFLLCQSGQSCDFFSVSDHGILHFFKSPSVKYNYTQIRQTRGKRFGRSPDKKNGQQ